jgi:Ca2+/H+ antiporter, TMEM165/GDT1 family
MDGLILPFLTVLLAELGDKSFLTVSLLASKTNRHLTVFGGAFTAYIIINTLTAFAGHSLADMINLEILTIGAGIIFILFGIKSILSKEETSPETLQASTLFRSTFGLIFIAEIGDRTNIATGLFATQYHPLIVLLGVLTALAIVTLLAIELGKWMAKRVNHTLIAQISGLIFIAIGVWMLV